MILRHQAVMTRLTGKRWGYNFDFGSRIFDFGFIRLRSASAESLFQNVIIRYEAIAQMQGRLSSRLLRASQ